MLPNLEDFFNGVVDNEENKDTFASHHKVIQVGDITDQFYRTKIEGRNASTSSRVFKQESEERNANSLIMVYFVPGNPWFNFSGTLVNSQLVCLRPVGDS